LLLVKQKNEVEDKNREVEEARLSLEEKAEQLHAYIKVQIGVPCEHVARVADAIELVADPCAATV
jgi:hypothetical protein